MNQQSLDSYLFRRLNEEIDLMKQAIESYKRNKPDNHESLILDCEVRIFNACVNLGDFDQAYNYAKTIEDKKLLTRLMMALLREEKESCKCSIDSIAIQGGSVELPLFFMWRRIFHQKLGYWVDIYKCTKCNFMTAHPNANATHSARKLERTRNNPEMTNAKIKPKDQEALK